MTRDELQTKAAFQLKEERRLILQWATGCGKSLVAIRFIDANPWMKTLILVPEQNNIKNWQDEFDKFYVNRENITIQCYASFKKYRDTKWDFLVFDEMPHLDTEKRLNICRSVSANYILALGAVIDDDERQSLESVYGKFYKHVLGLQQAIWLGLLPHPTVNVLHLSMSKDAKEKYDAIQRKVDNAVNAYNSSASLFNRTRMLRAGNERKRFLGSLKEDAIRRVCQKLDEKNRRYLCFCSSIKLAESLGGDHAFTSKTPASMKLLEKFNNHEIDSLYVVGKLIEGQNLNDIQCGVLGQLG